MISFFLKNNKIPKKLIFSLLIFSFFSCENETEKNSVSKNSRERLLIKTVYGNLIFKLFETKAPSTVKRFKELVDSGYYQGITFHRVIHNTLLQTGDPTNSGKGGTGTMIKDEKSDLIHVQGSLAMAKKNGVPDSGDSQFYISLGRLPELDNKFTIFGKLIKGQEILSSIRQKDKILSISITHFSK